MASKLDPKTLRWAARKAGRYRRELEQIRDETPSPYLQHAYERSALTASVLHLTFLAKARAVERKRKPTR